MDLDEIYSTRRKVALCRLVGDENRGSIARMAEKTGIAASAISDMLAHIPRKAFGELVARRIEDAYQLPSYALDIRQNITNIHSREWSGLLDHVGAVTIVTSTRELEMEYTSAALEVARAWMDLPRNERDEFKRLLEQAAEKYRAPKPPPKK